MIVRRGVLKALVAIAVLPAISGVSAFARAQEFFDAPGLIDLAVQEDVWPDDQFETWVNQIVRQINDHDSPERGRLAQRLALRLDWIEATCKTSEAQRNKFQIAGRGDIKRFFDDMREMKRRFLEVKGNALEFAKIQRRLAKIQTSSGAEIFGQSSLLAKTLRTTLSAEQLAVMVRAEQESREYSRRAAVEQAVQICDIAVGLKDEQRGRLTELFMLETRKLEPDESLGLPLQPSMVWKRVRLSREKFKAIVDERQWRALVAVVRKMELDGNAVGFARIPFNGAVHFIDVGELFIAPEAAGIPAKPTKE